MGSQSGKEPQRTNGSFIERSIQSLRGAVAAIGGAAAVSSLAGADTVARELSRADRRRPQRERDDDDDGRKRNGRDDDDNGDDQLSVIRARHDELRESMSSPTRRATSRQTADEDNADGRRSGGDAEDDGNGSTGGGRSRRDGEATATDTDGDITETIRTQQTIESDSPEPASSGAVRVGSGDTFASVDAETGTAIAESNGVRAIAGPDGAFIEGTPGGSPPPTSGPGAGAGGGPSFDDDDGGGDDSGGDNGDSFDS